MVCMANVLITMASATAPALQTCTACATYCNFNLGKKCPTGFCHGSAKQMRTMLADTHTADAHIAGANSTHTQRSNLQRLRVR